MSRHGSSQRVLNDARDLLAQHEAIKAINTLERHLEKVFDEDALELLATSLLQNSAAASSLSVAKFLDIVRSFLDSSRITTDSLLNAVDNLLAHFEAQSSNDKLLSNLIQLRCSLRLELVDEEEFADFLDGKIQLYPRLTSLHFKLTQQFLGRKKFKEAIEHLKRYSSILAEVPQFWEKGVFVFDRIIKAIEAEVFKGQHLVLAHEAIFVEANLLRLQFIDHLILFSIFNDSDSSKFRSHYASFVDDAFDMKVNSIVAKNLKWIEHISEFKRRSELHRCAEFVMNLPAKKEMKDKAEEAKEIVGILVDLSNFSSAKLNETDLLLVHERASLAAKLLYHLAVSKSVPISVGISSIVESVAKFDTAIIFQANKDLRLDLRSLVRMSTWFLSRNPRQFTFVHNLIRNILPCLSKLSPKVFESLGKPNFADVEAFFLAQVFEQLAQKSLSDDSKKLIDPCSVEVSISKEKCDFWRTLLFHQQSAVPKDPQFNYFEVNSSSSLILKDDIFRQQLAVIRNASSIEDINTIFFIGVVFSGYGGDYETIAFNYASKAKEQLELASFSAEKTFESTIGDMLQRVYKALTSIASAMLARKETEKAVSILQSVQDAEASAKLGDIFTAKAGAERDQKKAKELLLAARSNYVKAKNIGADSDLASLLDAQLKAVSTKLSAEDPSKKAAESTMKRSEHSQRAKELQAKFASLRSSAFPPKTLASSKIAFIEVPDISDLIAEAKKAQSKPAEIPASKPAPAPSPAVFSPKTEEPKITPQVSKVLPPKIEAPANFDFSKTAESSKENKITAPQVNKPVSLAPEPAKVPTVVKADTLPERKAADLQAPAASPLAQAALIARAGISKPEPSQASVPEPPKSVQLQDSPTLANVSTQKMAPLASAFSSVLKTEPMAFNFTVSPTASPVAPASATPATGFAFSFGAVSPKFNFATSPDSSKSQKSEVAAILSSITLPPAPKSEPVKKDLLVPKVDSREPPRLSDKAVKKTVSKTSASVDSDSDDDDESEDSDDESIESPQKSAQKQMKKPSFDLSQADSDSSEDTDESEDSKPETRQLAPRVVNPAMVADHKHSLSAEQREETQAKRVRHVEFGAAPVENLKVENPFKFDSAEPLNEDAFGLSAAAAPKPKPAVTSKSEKEAAPFTFSPPSPLVAKSASKTGEEPKVPSTFSFGGASSSFSFGANNEQNTADKSKTTEITKNPKAESPFSFGAVAPPSFDSLATGFSSFSFSSFPAASVTSESPKTIASESAAVSSASTEDKVAENKAKPEPAEKLAESKITEPIKSIETSAPSSSNFSFTSSSASSGFTFAQAPRVAVANDASGIQEAPTSAEPIVPEAPKKTESAPTSAPPIPSFSFTPSATSSGFSFGGQFSFGQTAPKVEEKKPESAEAPPKPSPTVTPVSAPKVEDPKPVKVEEVKPEVLAPAKESEQPMAKVEITETAKKEPAPVSFAFSPASSSSSSPSFSFGPSTTSSFTFAGFSFGGNQSTSTGSAEPAKEKEDTADPKETKAEVSPVKECEKPDDEGGKVDVDLPESQSSEVPEKDADKDLRSSQDDDVRDDEGAEGRHTEPDEKPSAVVASAPNQSPDSMAPSSPASSPSKTASSAQTPPPSTNASGPSISSILFSSSTASSPASAPAFGFAFKPSTFAIGSASSSGSSNSGGLFSPSASSGGLFSGASSSGASFDFGAKFGQSTTVLGGTTAANLAAIASSTDMSGGGFSKFQSSGFSASPAVTKKSDDESNTKIAPKNDEKKEDQKEAKKEDINRREEAPVSQSDAPEMSNEEFLQANASKEGFIALPSGVQYKVIKRHEQQGRSPLSDDSVEVHYTGRLINGSVFDSSRSRGRPSTFAVNRVVPGFSEALKLMTVGDEFEVVIPPKLGYGSNAKPNIPPNSVLIFNIQLLGIVKVPEAFRSQPAKIPDAFKASSSPSSTSTAFGLFSGAPSSSPSAFNFSSASSASSSSSLFGSSSSGLFGSASSSSSFSAGLFGSASSTASFPAGVFGSPSSAPSVAAPSSSAFSSGLFGSSSTTPSSASSPSPFATGIFGPAASSAASSSAGTFSFSSASSASSLSTFSFSSDKPSEEKSEDLFGSKASFNFGSKSNESSFDFGSKFSASLSFGSEKKESPKEEPKSEVAVGVESPAKKEDAVINEVEVNVQEPELEKALEEKSDSFEDDEPEVDVKSFEGQDSKEKETDEHKEDDQEGEDKEDEHKYDEKVVLASFERVNFDDIQKEDVEFKDEDDEEPTEDAESGEVDEVNQSRHHDDDDIDEELQDEFDDDEDLMASNSYQGDRMSSIKGKLLFSDDEGEVDAEEQEEEKTEEYASEDLDDNDEIADQVEAEDDNDGGEGSGQSFASATQSTSSFNFQGNFSFTPEKKESEKPADSPFGFSTSNFSFGTTPEKPESKTSEKPSMFGSGSSSGNAFNFSMSPEKSDSSAPSSAGSFGFGYISASFGNFTLGASSTPSFGFGSANSHTSSGSSGFSFTASTSSATSNFTFSSTGASPFSFGQQ